MRVTTLNDKSDMEVRYELFERLNTGGVSLHPQEIRGSIFRGPLNEQIRQLSRNKAFRKVAIFKQGERSEAIYEESVLRFFAFRERYKEFDHLVAKFLNEFMVLHDAKGLAKADVALFEKTMTFVASELPNGIVRGNRSATPLNLYEAISVGTALAFKPSKAPKKGVLKTLVNSSDLKELTTGGTNTRQMVTRRIELVRDALV
jgi:hypothetical protein